MRTTSRRTAADRVVFFIAAALLSTTLVLSQEWPVREWQFEAAKQQSPFGPSLWILTEKIQFTISCDNTSNPQLSHSEDSPMRLSVGFIWRHLPEEVSIAGTNRLGRPVVRDAEISFRIDEGRFRTQEWMTMFGYQQRAFNDEAVDFLKLLLQPAHELTVSADFTDDETRSESIDLTDFGDLIARMRPNCDRLEPLFVEADN